MDIGIISDNLPAELQPHVNEIKEIDRLCKLLHNNKAPSDILDLGAILAFGAMKERGELQEAYDHLLGHLKKKVFQLGLN